MRIRLLAAGALTVATLAACSSSGGTTSGTGSNGNGGGVTSTSPATTSTASGGGSSPQAFCGELKSAQKKLSGLASRLGSPAEAGSKLDPIISELQQLKADAPAELQTQFGDLASAFQQIKSASGGGASNLQAIAKQLRKLAPKLEKDGKTIEHYLATKCAGS